MVFGTPDWIRTSDLQSRSLTLMLLFVRTSRPKTNASIGDKSCESFDTSMFFTLLLYHTSAADTTFSVQFQKKKRTKAHRFLRSVRFLCVKLCSYYRPSNCFFFASNSSWVIISRSSSSLNFFSSSAGDNAAATLIGVFVAFFACSICLRM